MKQITKYWKGLLKLKKNYLLKLAKLKEKGKKEGGNVLTIATELVIRMAFIVGVTMAFLYWLAYILKPDTTVWEKVY